MKQNKQKLLSLILSFAIMLCSFFGVSVVSTDAKETETAQTSGLFDTYYMDVGDTKVISLNFNDIDYAVQSTAWVSNAPFDVEIIDQGFGYCQIRVNRYISVKVIITCNYNYQRLDPMTNQIWLMNGAESFYVVVNEEDTPVVTPTTPNNPDTPTTSEQTLDLSTQGVYKYKIKSDGTIEITDFDVKLETSIKVPDIINGRKVTSIGSNAFEYCKKLTNVTIPEGITEINPNAFYCCEGLKTVILPEGLTRIYAGAFKNCFSLEEIKLPESLKIINASAFSGCKSLTEFYIPANITLLGENIFEDCFSLKEITVNENNISYSSADGVLFNKEMTSLIVYPSSKTNTSYSVPVSVRDINTFAFSDNAHIETVIIPLYYQNLSSNTFDNCTNLKKIYIPKSTNQISNKLINSDKVTICGVEGSHAQTYALNNGYEFIAVAEYTDVESGCIFWPVHNDTTVGIKEVTDEENISNIKQALGAATLMKAYELSVKEYGTDITSEVDINVKIPANDTRTVVLGQNEDGNLKKLNMVSTNYYNNVYRIVNTNGLNIFVLVIEAKPETPTIPEEPAATTEPSQKVTTTATVSTAVITEPSESTMLSTDAPVPTTVNKPTETSTNPSEFYIGILGDADDNGKITIKDATIIQKHLAKISEIAEDNLKLCDVDANDKLNIRDVTNIQKWLAKISVDCKIGEAIFSENNISATTIAPTNQAPTTLVPTTVAPTTQAPTTQPTTVAPPVETDPIEDPYDPPVYGQTYTVCFTNNKCWSGTVYAYTWDVMGGNNGEWPGQPMTHYGTNDFGEDRYTYEVQAGHTFVIFTDGTSKSVDVDLTMYTDFGFFLLDTQNSKGAFDIGNYPFV